MPEVDVIIPAFNPGAMLGEAIDSLDAQTFTDWEAVVVDDGSEGDLRSVVRKHPKVRVLRQENAGASVARNRGILASGAPLIAFMDQDDLWKPDKLRRQVAALGAWKDAGLCYCDLTVLEPGQVLEPWHLGRAAQNVDVELVVSGDPEISRIAESLRHFGNAFVVPSTVMVRRETLAWCGLLDPWMPFTGDFDLLIRAGSVRPVIHLRSEDVVYRRHGENFSRRYEIGRRELRRMRQRYLWYADATQDKHLKRATQEVLRRPRRLYAAQAFDEARAAWRRRAARETAAHLARSVSFDPRIVLGAVAQRVGGRTG